MTNVQLIAMFTPVLSSMTLDLMSYAAALSKDPNATFNRKLFIVRTGIGVLFGIAALIGVNLSPAAV